MNLGDQISEDYIANGRLDTEDEPFPGQAAGDGLVSREEDLGIDGRNDEAELNFYLRLQDAAFDTTGSLAERKQAFAALYPDPDPLRPNRSADDPEGDNWKYDGQRNKNDYSRINGTEGNKKDIESGDRPDHGRPQQQRCARPTQQLLPLRDRPVLEPLRGRRYPK